MPFNVSRHLREAAKRTPDRPAVVLPRGETISFAQLDAECDRFAHHFAAKGLKPGMRVVVFVKPGFAFVPTIFGCFRLGAIPVCIDPGMKLKNILTCVKEAEPEALIGITAARAVARFFPKAFASVKVRIGVPRIRPGEFSVRYFSERESELAAILFTSGSTGVPKGVVYDHEAFDAQQRLLRQTYAIGDDEIDLVVFPLFALFTAAWGITAVIPKMNPARPAKTSGEHLSELIEKFGITHTSGSPAIWKNLAAYREGRRLPTLRRILMAGAQVPEKLVRDCREIAGEVHTPYGATEALPLTTISHAELAWTYVDTRRGAGTCVGKPLPGVDIAILPIIDEVIPRWDDTLRRPTFTKGEIAVRAAWVTREYFGKAEATRKAKIPSDRGVWHRMGDVGYLDDRGRLWFCGRKDHRILSAEATVFPDPLEAIFDGQPGVRRSAVVGVGIPGAQRAVLVVDGERKVLEELRAFARKYAIEDVVFDNKFPVDVRHNIKIDRLGLARRIEGELS